MCVCVCVCVCVCARACVRLRVRALSFYLLFIYLTIFSLINDCLSLHLWVCFLCVCLLVCLSVCLYIHVCPVDRTIFLCACLCHIYGSLSFCFYVYLPNNFIFLSMYCTYASLSVFTRVYTCTYLTGEMSTSMTVLLLSGGNPQSFASIMT